MEALLETNPLAQTKVVPKEEWERKETKPKRVSRRVKSIYDASGQSTLWIPQERWADKMDKNESFI